MSKDAMEPSTRSASETDGFANRKLIRPSLARAAQAAPRQAGVHPERPALSRKAPPSERTHAENFHYQKQMQGRTPIVVVLRDGEQVQGVIAWYDKRCLKLHRSDGQPNLLIYKRNIKYIFKQTEDHNSGNHDDHDDR